jgi:hypothetical protein
MACDNIYSVHGASMTVSQITNLMIGKKDGRHMALRVIVAYTVYLK